MGNAKLPGVQLYPLEAMLQPSELPLRSFEGGVSPYLVSIVVPWYIFGMISKLRA